MNIKIEIEKLITEGNELQLKESKLNDFMFSDTHKGLSSEMQMLMGIQLSAMNQYLNTLDRRVCLMQDALAKLEK